MSQNDKQAKAKVEEAEPGTGLSAVPVWMIVLLGALLYWGTTYLDGHGGGFNQEVFEPYTSHAEIAAMQPYDPKGHLLAVGQDTFSKTCILCHQSTGLGKEGQFPPLAGSDWLLASSPTRIGRIVLNGLSGPIRVDTPRGPVSLNATMAPLGDNLSDEQIAGALTYVRQQWGNNAAPITPEEIKAIRAASASKHGPWSPDELSKMPLKSEAPAK